MVAKAFVLRIPAVAYAFSFIRPSIEVFAIECGLSEKRAAKLVLATEEVFSYCCKLVSKGKKRQSLSVSFHLDQTGIAVVLEYEGPQGTLEKRFSASGSGVISRDSFEALGLYLAKEAVDSLHYRYEIDGTNKYSLRLEQEIPRSVFLKLPAIE